MRRLFVAALLVAGLPLSMAAQELRLPNKEGSVKFAVIGDSGTGGRNARQIGRQMAEPYRRSPFGLLVHPGDIVYYGDLATRYEQVFVHPLRPSSRPGSPSGRCLETMSSTTSSHIAGWNASGFLEVAVAVLHHPPYSSGRHGSHLAARLPSNHSSPSTASTWFSPVTTQARGESHATVARLATPGERRCRREPGRSRRTISSVGSRGSGPGSVLPRRRRYQQRTTEHSQGTRARAAPPFAYRRAERTQGLRGVEERSRGS